jgi:hypothetical protein
MRFERPSQMRLLGAAVCLLLFQAVGCLPGPVTLPVVGGDEYEHELLRWTRKAEVYRHFEAKIFLTATYQSREFRNAYLRKRTAILGLGEQDRLQFEQEQRKHEESFHEFFVAVYTGQRRWNDLDRKPSLWRVTLVNDRNERVAPLEVIRLDQRDAEVLAFYPFFDAFTQGYMIRFPKTSLELSTPIIDETVRSFSLQLSSSIAVVEVSWEHEGKPAAATPSAP